MKTIKNRLWKCVDFIYKHKVISFLIAFTIATSFILYGVFANDDEYANHLAVSNASIELISDGSGDIVAFDDVTYDGTPGTEGKDSSDNNGVLRNFDRLSYSINYSLIAKDITLTEPVEGRTVIVDVIIPKNINTYLTSDDLTGEVNLESSSLDQNYNYFELVLTNIQTSTATSNSNVSFTLNDVNSQQINASFTPIIVIKESTDERFKAISELTQEEKETYVESIQNEQRVSCDTNTLKCSTSITGKYDFDVAVLQGSYNESQNTLLTKKFPIGLAVTIPRLIGIYIPQSISLTLDTTADTGLTVSYVDDSFVSYKDPSKGYSINIDQTTELANIANTVSYSDGVVTISNLKRANNSTTIGTVAFELSSTRASETDKTNRNITLAVKNLKVGDTTVKESSGTKTVTDYYEKFVGRFGARIDIYPGESTEPKTEGSAFLSINQPFRIVESISYAYDGAGDDLDELHNYIKIDNEAFLITEEENSVTTSGTSVLRYGRGLWTEDYFELTGVSGCPTSVDKEKLMNLYGGPCIREKENMVVWNDSESELPIIIVDAWFGDKEDNTDNVSGATNALISLSGKVKNDLSLIDSSHQITTMSTGFFNNQLYYLSNNINSSDVTNAKNPNNYQKSVYNFINKIPISNNITPCGEYFCNITGDTVHVTAFTTNKPVVKAYFNDIERNVFYDYPIEWRINQNVTDYSNQFGFENAIVSVFIPKELNYINSEVVTDNKRTYKTPTRVDKSRTEGTYLTYSFNEDEIHNGALDTLCIYTDIFMDTKSNEQVGIEVYTIYGGYIPVGDRIEYVKDSSPLYYREVALGDILVTLKNDRNITTSGSITSTRYMEKNKWYLYNMKAYNNSSVLNVENSGYSYENATLYYVLPYMEDSNYKIYNKSFSNTNFKIALDNIGNSGGSFEGYTVYYTTDAAKNVVSDIYNATNPDSSTVWKVWDNPLNEVEATAVKIVKNDNWEYDTYFTGVNGIQARILPINNAQADAYYNGFIMAVDRPSNYPDDECDPLYENCSEKVNSSRLYYQSAKSLVEVYSRKISGFVFEDYSYDDLYENDEKQLDNIVVELYKLNNESFTPDNASNPNAYIDSTKDELIATTATDSRGAYSFTGLEAGNYYVLFRYDGDKYTPCNKYAGIINHIAGADEINSKAVAKSLSTDEAVTDIITLSETDSEQKKNQNLGLRIRKEFTVEINKYITKVEQTSNQGTKIYEYDKATKVNIDIKNMRNTKFRVTYSFDIVNTRYFPGYIGVIADLVPSGMTFDGTLEENKDWVIYDGVLYYTGLQDKLLLPGDKQYFSLVLDLDTNEGGTYTNIVAAQQPILLGDESADYDFTSVTVETDTPVETTPNTGNSGSDTTNEGNGE